MTTETGTLYGRMAVRNRFDDIKGYVQTKNPVIVDGGANVGATIKLFLCPLSLKIFLTILLFSAPIHSFRTQKFNK